MAALLKHIVVVIYIFILMNFYKSVYSDIDFNTINEDGSYRFRHTNDDFGGFYHIANASPDNIVQGRYGSRSPATGQIEETVYSAGPRGFRANGSKIHRKTDLAQYPPPPPRASPDDPLADPYNDPTYSFNFRTLDHSRSEDSDASGRIRGLYSYLDDEGERHSVRYAAGAGIGFEVSNAVPDNPARVGYTSPLYRAHSKARGKMTVQRGPGGTYKLIAAGPDHRRAESRSPDGLVRGTYSFLDDKGVQRTVEYVAGAGIGYRIVQNRVGLGTHINPSVSEFRLSDTDFKLANDFGRGAGGGLRLGEAPRVSSSSTGSGSRNVGASSGTRRIDGPSGSGRSSSDGHDSGYDKTKDRGGSVTRGDNRRGGLPGESRGGSSFGNEDFRHGGDVGKSDGSGGGESGEDIIRSGSVYGIGVSDKEPEPEFEGEYLKSSDSGDGETSIQNNIIDERTKIIDRQGKKGEAKHGDSFHRKSDRMGQKPSLSRGGTRYVIDSNGRGVEDKLDDRQTMVDRTFNRVGGGDTRTSANGQRRRDKNRNGAASGGGGVGGPGGAAGGAAGGGATGDGGGRVRGYAYQRPKSKISTISSFDSTMTSSSNNYNLNDDDVGGSLPPLITANRQLLNIDRERDWVEKHRDSTVIKNIGKWYIGLPPGHSVRAHVQSIDILPLGGRRIPSPSEALRQDEIADTADVADASFESDSPST